MTSPLPSLPSLARGGTVSKGVVGAPLAGVCGKAAYCDVNEVLVFLVMSLER